MIIPHDKLYIHMPYARLRDNLEEFCRLKVNCEIYIDADALDTMTKSRIELINTTFDKYNINKSIHGAFMDLNPGSADKQIRQVSFNRFKQCIDMCAKLKARRMVTHTFFYPIFYKSRKKQWLDDSLQVWQPISEYAKEKGVSIAIENSLDDSPWATLELLNKIKSFKACFDIAHYNVFSPIGWEEELLKYPQDSIIEAHLSDNQGKADEHLALGEGAIDFKKFFKILGDRKPTPYFTIEPHDKEGMLKGLKYITAANTPA
jgi:sugar phosphate isomerase/epimerase